MSAVPSLWQRLASEGLGTALLLATVVGSGIMAENLANGNAAIVLLGNALPTGAILVVLITMLGPISGAHFNPAVTAAFLLRREVTGAEAACYVASQLAGALAGVVAAHAMFDLPILQLSEKARTGLGQSFSELLATFGLVLTIILTLRVKPGSVPTSVGLYITAAYWFTASTSFANPAVTIARAFSDSFAGIALTNVPMFVLAQFAGMLLALGTTKLLTGDPQNGKARPA